MALGIVAVRQHQALGSSPLRNVRLPRALVAEAMNRGAVRCGEKKRLFLGFLLQVDGVSSGIVWANCSI